MQHFQALSSSDLETTTGGNLSLGDRGDSGGDAGGGDSGGGGGIGSWFSGQASKVGSAWGNVKDNLLGGIKSMMGGAGKYSGL